MKKQEIKKLSKDEVIKNIDKLKKDLFNFRFQKINSQVTNPSKIGETKKFGLLEIKALKCGSVNSLNEPGEAAYLQVKDLSDNRNNKIFVFNGWTFSSSTTLNPLDHPVYDFWLVGCENV